MYFIFLTGFLPREIWVNAHCFPQWNSVLGKNESMYFVFFSLQAFLREIWVKYFISLADFFFSREIWVNVFYFIFLAEIFSKWNFSHFFFQGKFKSVYFFFFLDWFFFLKRNSNQITSFSSLDFFPRENSSLFSSLVTVSSGKASRCRVVIPSSLVNDIIINNIKYHC